MEVSFVKELDFKGKDPVFDSNSCRSLVELRSINQVAADDDEEEDKCKHFTIRGYVAKVRRRDAKICWPLFLPHNQTSCDLVSSLPPLPVTKFKRWNCQKCLSETSTLEDVITDGAFIKVQNDEVNLCNTTFLINGGAANLLSGFRQPCEENIIDGRLVEADSSGNASNGECSPSLSCGNKENASIDQGLTKEGLQIHKGGPGRPEENQNQTSEPAMFAGEPTISPKECKMPLGVDINFPKADVLATISAHMSGHDSMHLNNRRTEASDNSMGLPNDINQNQDHSSELGNSYGRFHHKKVRKVRLLDDIIRSEEQNVSKKVHLSSGDAKANQTKNDNDRSPDTSYWKLQLLDNKSHLAAPNIQEMPIIEASQNEDEENSLMDWLKKMSKKAIGQKGHSENKHLGIYSGSSSEQGTNRHKQKSSLEKENKMSPLKPEWPFPVPQQDSYIAEDASTNLLTAKNVNNRSTGCTVSEKSLHHGPVIQEGNNKKAILSNKKNKAPPVDDSSKVKKKAIKKIKTRNMSEQEGLDGIPMDIVELLAKHQHERCLMNAGVAAESMHNLSEMTGKDNDSDKRCDENKVLDAVPEDLGQQRSHFNQAVDAGHTAMRNNRDADCRIEACDSTKFCKQNLHIDLNQQPAEFLELSQCSGEPLSRLEHPATVSNRSYSPQKFGWDKMKMQTSGSCHRNQAIAIKISGRNGDDGTTVPFNGTAFGSIMRKDDTHFNFMNVDSQDSCLDQSLKSVGQKTDCCDSHDSKFTSLQILGREQVDSSIDIHPEATYSFSAVGNGCHSRTIKPLDFYVSETISALHLLMLMDPSAGAGASDMDQSGSILETGLNCTDQCRELQGLDVGFRAKEIPRHPWGAGYSDQDQHQGNFSKPCHPVPRIGWSFLHKEIATQSNSHQTLQGFEARHAVELPPHNIIEKEKTDTSCSAIHTEVGNTETLLYMGIHSKQIVSGLDSVAHSSWSLTTNEMDQAGTSGKDRAVQPLTSHCELFNCVVNRNPADFTTPDEDEYMIGINNPRNRYISPKACSIKVIQMDKSSSE